MRYLKPALAGLVGGLLLAAAVLTVEFIYSGSVMASQIANCVDEAVGAFICDGAVQVGGGVELLIAFALGFAAGTFWFRRREP